MSHHHRRRQGHGGGRQGSEQTPTRRLHPPPQLRAFPPKYLKRGHPSPWTRPLSCCAGEIPCPTRGSRCVQNRRRSQPVGAYLVNRTPASQPHASTHPIFCILEAHVLHHDDGWRNLATWWEIKRQRLGREGIFKYSPVLSTSP